MAERKHTPGPWKQNGVSVRGRHQIDDVNNGPICITDARYDLHTGYEQADANAKLIAAAPDLLASLAALTTTLRHCGMTDALMSSVGAYRDADGQFVNWQMADLMAKADAALAKAEAV